MENVNEIGSHTEEVTQTTALPQADNNDAAVNEAFAAFGLEVKQEQDTDNAQEPTDPPIETEEERKGIKVKYNKEEVFIDEDKIPEYARKGLNYDKVEERMRQREAELDRVAKLQGYKDYAELAANLDKIEQEAQQQKEQQWQDLRQQLREEAEYNGLDTEKLDAWLDNHPLLQEAQRAVQERQQMEQERQTQTATQQWESKWQDLYTAYPELKTATDGDTPEWYTPEMQIRIDRGYDPKDAYELAHRDTLLQRSKQQATQRAIKEQRLGLRSQVEGDERGETEPEVPAELSAAFAAFGLSPKAAQKYVK